MPNATSAFPSRRTLTTKARAPAQAIAGQPGDPAANLKTRGLERIRSPGSAQAPLRHSAINHPLQGGDHLRPDRDHSQEQGQRGQRGSFRNNSTNHDNSPEQSRNIVPYLFSRVKGVLSSFDHYCSNSSLQRLCCPFRIRGCAMSGPLCKRSRFASLQTLWRWRGDSQIVFTFSTTTADGVNRTFGGVVSVLPGTANYTQLYSEERVEGHPITSMPSLQYQCS